MTLEGKVALVTGGGSGIGRGTAVRLARDGANICVADIDMDGAEETASMIREFGRDAITVRANVAAKPQVQEAFDRCVKDLGRLDVAVANAGIGRGASVFDMELKDWQDQVDINLTGVFLTVQAAAQRMRDLGNGGRIVCISSLAALNTGANTWSYSATKAGVAMMVRGWAQELGPHGITINAIGPGVIDTPLAHALAGDEGGPIRTNLEQRTPIGRVGRPSDIAGLISFMAGPDGEFMSGSYVLIDGGIRDARPPMAEDPNDPRVQEIMRHQATGMARREKLQPLIDAR
ncbi:MAG: SDR family oxidoreductase [Dehalococcoidia bacterium]|nr:SDR family oxidoreductase [Dehalococcoidia bacterium]